MARQVTINPESDTIRLYNYSNNESPAIVHQDLLRGRAYKAGQLWDKAEEDSPAISRERVVDYLEVGLQYHRSLVLWSRRLYGRPMWSPNDCKSSDDDLEALADIFQMCAGGRGDAGRDHKGTNACLDAIRSMLVHDFPADKLLVNPLFILSDDFTVGGHGRKMVRDLLVYGRCADEGWTKKWLQNWETADNGLGGGVGFLVSLAQEFAEAKVSGDAPDPMARCAYHDHSSVNDRALCRQGV